MFMEKLYPQTVKLPYEGDVRSKTHMVFFKPDMSQVMSDRGWRLLDGGQDIRLAGRKGGPRGWYGMSFGDR